MAKNLDPGMDGALQEKARLLREYEGREQHVIHHSANDGPKINVKVEKNSKGYNWKATVTDAKSIEQALELVRQAESSLQASYGDGTTISKEIVRERFEIIFSGIEGLPPSDEKSELLVLASQLLKFFIKESE